MKNSLGSINAASLAHLYDVTGKEIGTCMDTPNNMAYAMAINENVVKIKTPYMGDYERKDLENRFQTALNNSEYHKQYVKFKN